MRQDIVNITNELASETSLDFELLTTYNAISNYCKENKTRPRSNNYELKNGCLYINNTFIKRVEPLPPRPAFDEHSYIIEGAILAKNDIYF